MSGFDRITLYRLELPLRRPFATAAGSSVVRSLVLVALEAEGRIGLGEAAPFPGHSRDAIDAAWSSLRAAAPDLVEGRPVDALSLTAAAAWDQAATDLAARRAGQPMWRHLGGASPRAPAGWVAAATDPAAAVDAVAMGHAAGHRAVKVKIGPGYAARVVLAVKEAFPETAIGADANGSFSAAADPELAVLDAMDLAYLEQPIADSARPELTAFAAASRTPVGIDESVPDARAVEAACTDRWAPLVVVKAGHLGTNGAATAIAQITAAGLTPRIGGLVETSVGRHHAAALATLVPTSPAGDLAAGSPYFEVEPAIPGLRLDRGDAVAPSTPGIGAELDMDVVRRFSIDTATFG